VHAALARHTTQRSPSHTSLATPLTRPVGGDLEKKLWFRNTSAYTLKVTAKLPKAKFLFMQYPVPIIIAPGMSKFVSIHFRPIREVAYEDHIEVVCGGAAALDGSVGAEQGSFFVKVRASVTRLSVDVVDAVDLGFCPVHETSQQQFVVENDGEVPAAFAWSFKHPFDLSPASGVVLPGCRQLITLSFSPTEAAGLDSLATLVARVARPGDDDEIDDGSGGDGYGGGGGGDGAAASAAAAAAADTPHVTRTLHISAISKYPHLCIPQLASSATTASHLGKGEVG
jgi:hypothetical protein